MRIDEDYARVSTLDDGTRVRTRLLKAGDRDGIALGFERLSPESRYRRFFSAMPSMSERLLAYLTTTDNVDHLAIVGERLDGGDRAVEGLGIARFVRLVDHPDVAEAAVAVVDNAQRKGLGRVLLTELAIAARERGILRFRGYVQADNEPTQRLTASLVEDPEIRFDGTGLVYEVDLPRDPSAPAESNALYRLMRVAAHDVLVVLRSMAGAS